MVAEIEPIEAADFIRRDVRIEQQRRPKQDNREPMLADELAERVDIELRGSSLFVDVPARPGRRKPQLS